MLDDRRACGLHTRAGGGAPRAETPDARPLARDHVDIESDDSRERAQGAPRAISIYTAPAEPAPRVSSECEVFVLCVETARSL